MAEAVMVAQGTCPQCGGDVVMIEAAQAGFGDSRFGVTCVRCSRFHDVTLTVAAVVQGEAKLHMALEQFRAMTMASRHGD